MPISRRPHYERWRRQVLDLERSKRKRLRPARRQVDAQRVRAMLLTSTPAAVAKALGMPRVEVEAVERVELLRSVYRAMEREGLKQSRREAAKRTGLPYSTVVRLSHNPRCWDYEV